MKKFFSFYFLLILSFNLLANNPELDEAKVKFEDLTEKEKTDLFQLGMHDLSRVGWETDNSKKALSIFTKTALESEILNILEVNLPIKFKKNKKKTSKMTLFLSALKSLPASFFKATSYLNFTAQNKDALSGINSLALKGDLTTSFLMSLCFNKEAKIACKLIDGLLEEDLIFNCAKERIEILRESEKYKNNSILLVSLEEIEVFIDSVKKNNFIDSKKIKPLKFSSALFCLMSFCSTLKYFWSNYRAKGLTLNKDFDNLLALSIFQNHNFEVLKESEFIDSNAKSSLGAILENCFFYNVLPAAIISNFSIPKSDKKNLFDQISQNKIFQYALINSCDFIKDVISKSTSDALFDVYFNKYKKANDVEKTKQEVKHDFFNKIRKNSLGLFSASTPKDILEGLQVIALSETVSSQNSIVSLKKQSLKNFSPAFVFMLNTTGEDAFDSAFNKKGDALVKNNPSQIAKNYIFKKGLSNVLGFALEKAINKSKNKVCVANAKIGKIALTVAKKIKVIKPATARKIPLLVSALIKSSVTTENKNKLQDSNQYFEVRKDNLLQSKAYNFGDKLAYSHGVSDSISRIIAQSISKKIIQSVLGSSTQDLIALSKKSETGFFANLRFIASVLKLPVLFVALGLQAKYEKIKSQKIELGKLQKKYELNKDENLKIRIDALTKSIALSPEEEEALSSFNKN